MVKQNIDDLLVALAVSQNTKHCVKDTKDRVVNNIQELFTPFLKEFDDLDVENFSIAPHVLLPNDFDLSKEYSELHEQKLDSELLAMKQEFLQVSKNYLQRCIYLRILCTTNYSFPFQNSMMLASLKSEWSQYNSIKEFIKDETIVQQNVHRLIEEIDVDHITESMNSIAEILQTKQ